MTHLAPLISDLALILICAGAMTLLFKRLKQPLVLGYIVAGFLASPHFSFTPSVADTNHIHIWSEIGVIFLLFGLGLEFSFKKLMKMGGSAVISAGFIIICMLTLGIGIGWAFGWSPMDCLFLGAMISMSSTTIIYKAFDDLGLRTKKFTDIVLSILIVEDILAVVMMVLLSTLSVSRHFDGGELTKILFTLGITLTLWFFVGLYLIPILLKRTRQLMSNETLLIVALALCLGLVVMAAQAGLSPAFGAFIMGSILAETIESEQIEALITPVKDLFGAVFFVSVGMMVDPALIVEYIVPILALVIAVIAGQILFGTLGVILSGKSLKTAVQSGFSLTQIGEFAFIIASLGISLKVISTHLYPIVVAVSVITTFLTPYMIRLADPAYERLLTFLPSRWVDGVERYTSQHDTVNKESDWRKYLKAITKMTVIYLLLTLAAMVILLGVVYPLIMKYLPNDWGRLASIVLILVVIAPFLRPIMMKKNHSEEFKRLWADSRYNHAPLIATIVVRTLIVMAIVVYLIHYIYATPTALAIGVAVLLVGVMMFSRLLKKQSIVMERTFVKNLQSKEAHQEYAGKKVPAYAGKLVDKDFHLSDFTLSPDSLWAGKRLAELDFSRLYDIQVVSILRGTHRLNIPGGEVELFPYDKLQVIGTDQQLAVFSQALDGVATSHHEEDTQKHRIELKYLVVEGGSIFDGRSIVESRIRKDYHCMIVGVESGADGGLHLPDVHAPLHAGDTLWVVGEEEDLQQLFTQKKGVHL